ncbi:MAG: competence protein CoiA family protein [Flavobacteriales bacterium]
MSDLQIPFALTKNKKPVTPQTAEKGQDCFCPQCNRQVILRKGDIRQHHFAHKKDTECSGETVIHKTAKNMIAYAWQNPRNMIDTRHDCFSPTDVYIARKCEKCGASAGGNVLVGDIGEADDVQTEVGVGNKRVDVAFMSCGIPLYGIEVRHTHNVPEEKWDAFYKWKFPCVEVDAQQVIDSWETSLKDAPSFRTLYLKTIKNNFNNDLIHKQLHRYDCQHCNPERFVTL